LRDEGAATPFKPAYKLLTEEQFLEKVKAAEEILKDCRLCPRACGVDRTNGEKGVCKTLDRPFVSSWGPHYGEEPPLVGMRGSGTIFFTHCNLKCVFCQNWQISHLGEGSEITHEELSDIMLGLQQIGCHNINLVTPTHQVPMIMRAVMIAQGNGLVLPIVYNTGGYDSVETLKLLGGVVDIYMPDLKYSNPEAAKKYSKAPDYPKAARAALKEMHRQVGDLVLDERGIALRGMILRHLVLPEDLAGTEEAMRFLAEELSKDTYINLMDQYRPCYKAHSHPELSRRITRLEFEEAVRLARKAGLWRFAE
jgi:putative pyruvate formate lyase activating enzyme